MTTAVELARDWLDAITRRDRDSLMALSHPRIRIHGPRGVAIGLDVLGEWFDATPMRITIRKVLAREPGVLVHHTMEWMDADGGVLSVLENASVLEMEGGFVASYQRIDDPERADAGETAPA